MMKRISFALCIVAALFFQAPFSKATVDNAVCSASDPGGVTCNPPQLRSSATEEVGALAKRTPFVVSISGPNGNTLEGCPTPAITSYVDGMIARVKPIANNTGPTTFNWCGIGAIAATSGAGVALSSGDLLSTTTYVFQYYHANVQWRSTSPLGAGVAIPSNSVTDSMLRQSAGTSVIGRATGSTGNVADIVASADGQFLRRNAGALAFAVPAGSEVTNTPSGSVAGATVQAAINELDTEKMAVGATAGGDLSGTYPNPTVASNSVALPGDTTGNYAAGDAEAGNALTGDSATAFFSAGAIEVARGGNGAAPGGDDQTLISSSTTAGAWATIPDSDGAGQKLVYDQGTNAFSAGTDDDVPDAGEVDDTALAAGAVDGGTGGEIADGSITADDLGTNSVAADEIAAGAVGSSEAAALDASDVTSGVFADAQVDGSAEADEVNPTLGSQTQGFYQSGNTAGNGISVAQTPAEAFSPTISLDFSAPGADPAFSADEGRFGPSGVVFEGSSADAVESRIAVVNPTTADKTFTIPDADSNPVVPSVCSGSDKVNGISSSGVISCGPDSGAGGGIANVVEDITPQLGGPLDTNGQPIEFGTANTDTSVVRSSAGNISIEGNVVYRAGGTDVSLADGGTGTTLVDPNADRLTFFDDSLGSLDWLILGSNLSITGNTINALGDLVAANNLSDLASAATARTNLGVAPGTHVQGFDADLSTWGAISPSANVQTFVGAADYAAMRAQLDLEGGVDFYSIAAANAAFQPLDTDLSIWAGLTPSANAQSLVTAANYAAMRALIDLEPGVDVQAYNARLADVSGITYAQGDLLYYNGTNLVNLAPGTSGQFLKTNGAAANPAWTSIPGGGDLISTNNLSDVASAATAFGNIKQAASDTATGVVELATNAETVTGTDTARATTPAGVAAAIAASTSPIDVQTFTSSGTWTKPSSGTLALIRAWGGGGSGSKGAAADAGGGGGGGGYSEKWIALSSLSSTETVTIGAGGAAVTAALTYGNAGGNTTFGSRLTAYGGGAASSTGSNGGAGGGGGGGFAAGGTASSVNGGKGGDFGSTTGWAIDVGQSSVLTGWGGYSGTTAYAPGPGNSPTSGGGGGASDSDATGTNWAGGNAINGGGGGGAAAEDSAPGPGAGGTSINGGNGGAGAFDASNATAGAQPGGGGGGSETGDSGAGGAGQVIVYVF